MTGVKTIFGSAGFGNPGTFAEEPAINACLDILEAEGVDTIDTAQIYGKSEEYLGKVNAGSRFTIDSKFGNGFLPTGGSGDALEKASINTIEKIGIRKLDVYYLHAPDAKTPIEETLAGIQKFYEAGHFNHFGLSNYMADDVRKVYNYCKANNYVLPTVYQGNYNAVARVPETDLFPTLRELGIKFYAYSPIAGGFLTKTAKEIQDGVGRFDKSNPIGAMYITLYSKPSYLEALDKWNTIADDVGCSKADLAYRWVKYNSFVKAEHGDGIIIGARNSEQLQQTLDGLKAGPLPDKAVKAIDEIWESIKHEAPIDNYHSGMKA